MAFGLIESAQNRWRAINGPHLVPLVRAGESCTKIRSIRVGHKRSYLHTYIV